MDDMSDLTPLTAPIVSYRPVSKMVGDNPLGIIGKNKPLPFLGYVRTEKSKKGLPRKVYSPKHLQRDAWWSFHSEKISSPVVVVDIDSSDAETRLAWAMADGLIPSPSYYIVNDSNGHAQVGWFVGIISMARDTEGKASYLLAKVRSSLTSILHGDPAFTGNRCRNPHYFSVKNNQRVMLPQSCMKARKDGTWSAMGKMVPHYSLSQLGSFLDSIGRFDDGSKAHTSSLIIDTAFRHALAKRIDGTEDTAKEYGSYDDMVMAELFSEPAADKHAEYGERNCKVFMAALSAARAGRDVEIDRKSVV